MNKNKELQLVLELFKEYGIFSFVDNIKKPFYIKNSENLVNLMKTRNTVDLKENDLPINLEAKVKTKNTILDSTNTLHSNNNNKVKGLNTSSNVTVNNESSLINNKLGVDKYNLKNINSLDELKNILVNFKECSLSKTATNTVFGVGNYKADLLMVGEAPGAEEDLQGVPFVGKSGQLLNKALSTINVYRDNIFTTNTIFWRPPGNRNPTLTEIQICKPFMQKIISIIKPKMVLIVGRVAATTLLEVDEAINKLRGKWLIKNLGYSNEVVENIFIRVIYHPAYLLRNPKQKKIFWVDLIEISNKIVDLKLSV